MFKSIRWRLQLWHAMILIVTVASFAGVMYWQLHRARMHEIKGELEAAAQSLASTLDSFPTTSLDHFVENGNSAEAMRIRNALRLPNTFSRPFHRQHESPYFMIWGSDGELITTSTVTVIRESDTSRRHHRDHPPHHAKCEDVFLDGPMGMTIQVGRDIERDLADLRQLLALLVATGASVLVLGLAGGWWLSSRAIRPINEISSVAAEISATNLSQRIDVTETDSELGSLATTLNSAFDRLQSAFEQQLQFTADASHELRTPLSVILMHNELALSRERSAEEYRQSIDTCHRSAQRMNGLVESLLTLARVDSGKLQLDLQRIDLAKLANDCVEMVRPLAEESEIEIDLGLSPVHVQADSTQLERVLMNLLSNAIRYNQPKGRITVKVAITKDDLASVSVSDTGIGIAPDDLAKVFDRFYRVDKNRSRDIGGSGLGLSICKTIVEAHNGDLNAKSELGVGTTFSMTLPVE